MGKKSLMNFIICTWWHFLCSYLYSDQDYPADNMQGLTQTIISKVTKLINHFMCKMSEQMINNQAHQRPTQLEKSAYFCPNSSQNNKTQRYSVYTDLKAKPEHLGAFTGPCLSLSLDVTQ